MQNFSVAVLFPRSLFNRESLTYKVISALLAWAMFAGSLPAYASGERRAEWVPPGALGTLATMPENANASVASLAENKVPALPLLKKASSLGRQPLVPLAAPAVPGRLPLLGTATEPVLALPGITDRALAATLKSLNSARVYPLLLQAGTLPLPVSVGFADSSSATANFPEPWNESNPSVNFVGGGTAYRAGAIRLDNPTGSALTIDSVKVDLGRPGPVFALWTNITVPANGSAILTQTQDGNFNTSASPIVGCGQPLVNNETRIPKITVTVAGAATDLLDTAHVLDTGGFDSSCRGNQSLDWRPIGSAGITSPAGAVQLSTQNAPHAVGT